MVIAARCAPPLRHLAADPVPMRRSCSCSRPPRSRHSRPGPPRAARRSHRRALGGLTPAFALVDGVSELRPFGRLTARQVLTYAFETANVRRAVVADVRRGIARQGTPTTATSGGACATLSSSVHDSGCARQFIRSVAGARRNHLAMVVDGEAVGGIGSFLGADVERFSAEIGYWLAEPFWGRGITREALAAALRVRVRHAPVTRIFAPAVRLEHGVVPRAGESGLRPGGAAAEQRGSSTAR